MQPKPRWENHKTSNNSLYVQVIPDQNVQLYKIGKSEMREDL